ncbi:MAG: gas vesicle protein [Deltaproteobacteria bacterium]|nr:gas vesicle protein [Deltaproteobacteria bacterium]
MVSLSIGEAVQRARKELAEVTGLRASSTLSSSRDERGWHVAIEMVEKRSIPDGMDILATYEVVLDPDGKLVEFSRKAMRKRTDAITAE